jgi:hypothetical protein
LVALLLTGGAVESRMGGFWRNSQVSVKAPRVPGEVPKSTRGRFLGTLGNFYGTVQGGISAE